MRHMPLALATALTIAAIPIRSDNGSEFINNQLYRYCIDREITFTRSRPGRKNDNCFVEQKNWPVVRVSSISITPIGVPTIEMTTFEVRFASQT